MNIDLTKPHELPDKFISRLKKIENLCCELKFSEVLVEHRAANSLVKDIDEHCMENKIIGVHYTRAIPENIRQNGLLIRTGGEIRGEFLEQHGHLFTGSELATIKERWASYFNSSQSSARDGRIFFNFTESALCDGGAKYLLELYGGEQISMCFEQDCAIGKKLGNIGQPLIVRSALDPNALNTYIDHPWGKILVSSYHLLVNSDAYGIDQDGHQCIPVEPENIIEIKAIKN